MQEDNTLVLIDGSSLAFRSFFALFTSGLRTKDGLPTWAILGFFNSLFELIEKYKPRMLAVTFDMAAPTFRHLEFEDYKAHRAEMPDDLSVQWPLLKEGVKRLGLPVYELAGYEADDVIGTIARDAEGKGFNVLILTGDQDAFQLIDDKEQKIKVLMPGKGGLQQYGRQEVFNKLGVWPEQITDYKGLCGDTSDNIPGIRGIGPKTAQQLLNSYVDIDGIYKHIDEIKSKALNSKLVEGEAVARQSKRLATIDNKVPIEFDYAHCHLTPPDIESLAKFFLELEFKNLTARLPKILDNFSIKFTSDQISDNGKIEKAPAKVEAIGNIAAESNGSSEALIKRQEGQIISSQAELEDLIKNLARESTFGLFINSSPWVPLSNDAVLYGEPNIFGYAIAWEKGAAYIPIRQTALALGGTPGLDKRLVQDKLNEILSQPKIGKIVYNLKQALNLLNREGMYLVNVLIDPMLASYICSSDEKHGLHDQAARQLNYIIERTNQKASAKKNRATGGIAENSEQIMAYAIEDAYLLFELGHYYLSHLGEEQKSLLLDMELPLSEVLAKIEQRGISLDLPYLTKFAQELADDLAKLEQQIFAFAGHVFNINSTQQLQKVLFEELGLKTKAKTKTGFSTDASVLESLRNEHQIIPLLLDYRQLTKLKSTYVDALPKMVSDVDKRLHGEFNQVSTSTGRLSSSNPNLQNIPIRTELGRRMRRAFIPAEENWYLLSVDYSQIELRLLAHMSGDERLIDAFQKDQDIHARTAGEIFDVPIEAVTSDMRRVGKTLNFALIYQQGPFATAAALGVSIKEASAFIEKYFKRYARVKAFMESTIELARKHGFVETLWKRRRYFKFINDRNEMLKRADERAACNAPLQGSAADLMKLAMIRLEDELSKAKLKSKLILQVHDELVLEVPETELEQVKELVVKVMQLDQPLKVPLKVDVGIARNWMDVKIDIK
jgi:DNA polymerase I